MSGLITIIVISPQMMFRKGIEATISSESDMKITDSVDFSNGVECSIENSPPDIAILDIDSSENVSARLNTENSKKHWGPVV